PVSLQTMWKESITDISANKDKLERILKEITELQMLGCDIIRFAVPDMESAAGLCAIAERTTMPLVADIHFDYRLALECLKGNVAAIRINPGNIGSFENTKTVVDACRDNGVAIRIGINSGSLPKDLQEKISSGLITRAQGLCETAVREADNFERLNFDQYVVSMKSSDVQETIDCNRFYAQKYNNPLHLGVTEAGPLIGGIVKSSIAFSTLLNEGIGDTIRVSLSSNSKNEVIAGLNILKECGKRDSGVTIVSCPRCGREGFDVHSFIERWQNKLLSLDKKITVAVMGCVVNGPGEGKHADLGIAGGKDKCIIFKKGEIVRTINSKDADKVFEEELNSL
ncbi:MAG: flavodoxin-dependent (E)-4-hydroxy-3-methylbut-2-enyl-diphosphate synthase, partial [Clostridia bacterium]|nr:flavodoxin-dependent (E)-4-hydroxy-3-methylbut-2-enyl-diphosphate synthase [Clostridia bacterium]